MRRRFMTNVSYRKRKGSVPELCKILGAHEAVHGAKTRSSYLLLLW